MSGASPTTELAMDLGEWIHFVNDHMLADLKRTDLCRKHVCEMIFLNTYAEWHNTAPPNKAPVQVGAAPSPARPPPRPAVPIAARASGLLPKSIAARRKGRAPPCEHAFGTRRVTFCYRPTVTLPRRAATSVRPTSPGPRTTGRVRSIRQTNAPPAGAPKGARRA